MSKKIDGGIDRSDSSKVMLMSYLARNSVFFYFILVIASIIVLINLYFIAWQILPDNILPCPPEPILSLIVMLWPSAFIVLFYLNLLTLRRQSISVFEINSFVKKYGLVECNKSDVPRDATFCETFRTEKPSKYYKSGNKYFAFGYIFTGDGRHLETKDYHFISIGIIQTGKNYAHAVAVKRTTISEYPYFEEGDNEDWHNQSLESNDFNKNFIVMSDKPQTSFLHFEPDVMDILLRKNEKYNVEINKGIIALATVDDTLTRAILFEMWDALDDLASALD